MWKEEDLYVPLAEDGTIAPIMARFPKNRLVLISGGLAIITLVLGITRFAASSNNAWMDTAAWTAAFIFTAWLFHRGQFRPAGHAIIAFGFVGTFLGALWQGGLTSEPMYWASFVPLCAIMFIGRQAGVVYLVAALVGIAAVGIATEFIPTVFAQLSSITIFAFGVGYLFESTRVENERRLAKQTLVNPLTKLPGRVLFETHVTDLLERVERHPFVLLVADVDGLKKINHDIGHPAGDELLRQLSRHFNDATRETEQTFHLMADQFAVLCREPDSLDDIQKRFQALELHPIDYLNATFSFSMSTGAVVATEKHDKDELLAIADSRMFSAKAKRRRRLAKVAVR